jgi:hypothetical protein
MHYEIGDRYRVKIALVVVEDGTAMHLQFFILAPFIYAPGRSLGTFGLRGITATRYICRFALFLGMKK